MCIQKCICMKLCLHIYVCIYDVSSLSLWHMPALSAIFVPMMIVMMWQKHLNYTRMRCVYTMPIQVNTWRMLAINHHHHHHSITPPNTKFICFLCDWSKEMLTCIYICWRHRFISLSLSRSSALLFLYCSYYDLRMCRNTIHMSTNCCRYYPLVVLFNNSNFNIIIISGKL